MKLVIVESPVKGKTIEKFLGPGYKVLSSYGHIRDLPKSKLGIDVENNFEPKYIVPQKARKVKKDLKEKASKAESIILATDEDREGEAIAWHLMQTLDLKENYQRIVFHEITKEAIENAFQNPRKINMDLVNAQQARRVLDRIVGYKLSPFLWKKITRGLSAGRVQSVALRLIAEREKEIENFVPQEYWSIEALLKKINSESKTEFSASLAKKDGKTIDKLAIKNKEESNEIIEDLEGSEYKIKSIEKKELKKNPLPPFTTSTLQQEAYKHFRFSAKMTMRTAQKLYETGLITYHRTDSLNLSQSSLMSAKKTIEKHYGKEYWPGFFRKYKTKSKGAQEAHEAIRPSFPENLPENLNKKLDEAQRKLYDLIWKRFIASQMSQAVFDATKIEIEVNGKEAEYIFRSNGQTLRFEGFLKVYPLKFKESELPSLKEKEILKLLKLSPNRHFTQPPPRYSEATLIKALEEDGIGRPSTYAPTLSTIMARNYVQKDENRKFRPTEIGNMVNDVLVKHFPKIVDIKFTAQMEQDLDRIAQGNEKWQKVVKDFYDPFEENLSQKYEEVPEKEFNEKPTGKICPKCNSPLIVRMGKFGRFYACSNFPKCKHTEALEKNELNIPCPKCKEGKITEKRTKRGKIFYGCSRWPECDFALWDKPTDKKCPKCGSILVEIKKKTKDFTLKCSNKECNYKE